MKLYELIRIIIKSLFLKNKFVFSVFIVGLFITVFSVIYNNADSNSTDYEENEYDSSLLTYTVEPSENGFDFESLSDAIEKLNTNDEIDEISIEIPFDESIGSFDAVYYNEENGYYSWKLKCLPDTESELFLNTENYYTVRNKIPLTGDDIENKNLILLCTFLPKWNSDIDTLSLYGTDFTIAGNIDVYEANCSFINLHSVKSISNKISAVYVKYKSIEDMSENNENVFYLSSVFANESVTAPVERNMQYEEHLSGKEITNILMMLLAFFSLAFLYDYILKSSQKTTEIFLLCGCKRLVYILACFLSVLLMIFCVYVSDVILYTVIFKDLFIKIQPKLRFALDSSCYISCAGLLLLSSVCVFIPVLLGFYQRKREKLKI